MAYVDQIKKAKIASALKLIVPGSWRYTLAVQHHSKLVLTIKSAPIDLMVALQDTCGQWEGIGNIQLNHYYLECAFSGALLETFEAIKKVMNLDNYDNSDAQSDHFDVGHYIAINIGKWDKPFVVK